MARYALALVGTVPNIDRVLADLLEEWPYSVLSVERTADSYSALLEFYEDLQPDDLLNFFKSNCMSMLAVVGKKYDEDFATHRLVH